ncbi:MAG: 5-dehydro-4-deoxy-D-glucuronate isomerase [Saprospiraceae bacterium]|nr:5-dehydro-4-deoxy-D-glucuronate isomerase [Saprospiraceae bacterium]
MQQRYESSPREVASMNTEALRANFLVENLFQSNKIELVYSHYDRMIIGGVVPVNQLVALSNPEGLKANFFLERRELGIINIGGNGKVTVDGTTYELRKMDCLYVSRGTHHVEFSSTNASQPAKYFLLSAPAHKEYETRLMTKEDATPQHLGATETANQRTIYKYIHRDGIPSCQLVMGLTVLNSGSVWNTMPPHTHDRRMEVYCYFDIRENQRVLHIMGQPQETRHLWIGNCQAVISPPWSIHAGCGTMSYAFIWGMAGENQDFTDMDFLTLDTLH